MFWRRPTHTRDRQAQKSIVRQFDEADCGPACLAWILRYYGGDGSMERLRTLSGTTAYGTTMLGLHQAARHVGLDSAAYRGDLSDLFELDQAAVLHVTMPGSRQHFLICFGSTAGRLIVGDPATGVSRMTPEALGAVWRSRALIILTPNARFQSRRQKAIAKRKWLLSAVREDAPILLLSTLIGAVISIFGLALAIFSRELIDDILPRRDVPKLLVGIVLLSLVLVVQAGVNVVRTLLLLRQARDFNIRITDRFLTDLLRLPFTFFSARKTGDLVARLNDTERLQQSVTNVLGNIVVDALVVAVGILFVMFYSVPIAVALVLVLAVMGVSTRRFHHPIVEGQHRMMAAHSVNESGYVEAIQAIETIKTTNSEAHFARWMIDAYARLQHEIFRLGKLGMAFSSTVDLIGITVVVGVLSWSSFLVLDASIGLGTLVALLQISGMIVPSARSLATANIRFQEASVAFDRMFQLTSLEPECDPNVTVTRRTVPMVHELTVEDLRFRYPGRDPLFEHVSFDCRSGDLLLLIGRTGSGKSTLLKILQRLLHPEAGRILVDGRNWLEYSMPSWRDAVGVVPQHVRMFSGTLLENICLGRSIELADVVDRCNRIGLQGYFEGLPAGYATVVGEGGVGLSGGQLRFVGIARALLRPCRLLLLDEPTVGMDDETAAYVRELIDRIRSQKIVIVASHASTFQSLATGTYRMS